ncbi:exosomal polycystin-1-interacting protein-like [Polymixia lowei]
MSLNRISSTLFPWLLWLLLFPPPVAPATDSTPTSATAASQTAANTTLLFDSGAPGSSLRNCSCSSHVRDCDEALANLLCSCRTVPRSALPPAGLREPGGLTVWLRESWVLRDLLNRSAVGHLRLSFCGMNPLDSQYLALLGLRTLRIHSAAPGVPYPNQEVTVSPVAGGFADGGTPPLDSLDASPSSSSVHVTLLDTALLNGLSALKAYSVVGPRASTLSQHFPNLPLPLTSSDPSDHQAPEPPRNCVLTFVY